MDLGEGGPKSNRNAYKFLHLHHKYLCVVDKRCHFQREELDLLTPPPPPHFSSSIHRPVSLTLNWHWIRGDICKSRCTNCINDTSGIGGKFAAGVVDTGLQISPQMFEKIQVILLLFQRLGGRWFTKKSRIKKSRDTIPLTSVRFTQANIKLRGIENKGFQSPPRGGVGYTRTPDFHAQEANWLGLPRLTSTPSSPPPPYMTQLSAQERITGSASQPRIRGREWYLCAQRPRSWEYLLL